MKIFWFFLFFCGLLMNNGQGRAAEDAPLVFQKANAAYQGGDYKEAGSLYESLARKGVQDANVYYNLANACFKQERPGLALLNYEKALRLKPRDRDIRANLAYVKGLLEYRIQDSRNWYVKTLDVLLGILTFEEWGTLSLAVGLSFWASWLVAWGWKRKALMILTVTLFSLWLFKGIRVHSIEEAIVLKPQASVRYGPSYKDQVAFKLGEGLKVHVKKKAGEWARVVLANGETGWMAQEEIGVI